MSSMFSIKKKKKSWLLPISQQLLAWMESLFCLKLLKYTFFLWHNARIYMFRTLLERFLYVHGCLVLLWWKSTSCLSSLYFSLASKWNQATASTTLLLLKFFTLQVFHAYVQHVLPLSEISFSITERKYPWHTLTYNKKLWHYKQQ